VAKAEASIAGHFRGRGRTTSCLLHLVITDNTTMRVLIVGATGPCGILLIQESLVRGHHVVIYARSPGKLPEEIVAHERVTIITGQLGDLEPLTRALQGVDAVLSALGPRVTNGPFHGSDTPIAKGYHALLQAMEAAQCKRLIALGTTSISVSGTTRLVRLQAHARHCIRQRRTASRPPSSR